MQDNSTSITSLTELQLRNLILSMCELINAIDGQSEDLFPLRGTALPFRHSETFKMAVKRMSEAYSTLKHAWDFKLERAVPAYARCVIQDSCVSDSPATQPQA